MKNFVEYSTDFLFWLLNGVPIMNTPWIMVYTICLVGGWALLFYTYVSSQRVNQVKREVLTMIEDMEYRIESLEK